MLQTVVSDMLLLPLLLPEADSQIRKPDALRFSRPPPFGFRFSAKMASSLAHSGVGRSLDETDSHSFEGGYVPLPRLYATATLPGRVGHLIPYHCLSLVVISSRVGC